MNWSSHNEALSSQLCSSGFQFHTQPSVSPLNGHHCPRHMQPRRILSTPPTCHTAERPLSPSVSASPTSPFCLSHTVTHSDTASLIMSLFVSLPSPLADTVWMFFQLAPRVCLSTSVMSVFWWNLTSRSVGDDTSDESLNQYLLFSSSLSSSYCLW